jgi:transposase
MIPFMPKKINYTLSTDERLSVEQAIKNHPDLRVRERARIIRLLDKGYKPEAIADLLAISEGQVYWWHKRWQAEGLTGLADKPRQGRPTVATEALLSRLERLIETDPQAIGYAFTVWNVPRLLAHLRQVLGVTMHENTLRNLLERMDYVYRRPKHDLSNLQDPTAKAQAEVALEELKKKRVPARSNFSLWTKRP